MKRERYRERDIIQGGIQRGRDTERTNMDIER